MVDLKKFEKVKDVETLSLLYAAEKQRAASMLEIMVVDAAARKALKRIEEGKKA